MLHAETIKTYVATLYDIMLVFLHTYIRINTAYIKQILCSIYGRGNCENGFTHVHALCGTVNITQNWIWNRTAPKNKKNIADLTLVSPLNHIQEVVSSSRPPLATTVPTLHMPNALAAQTRGTAACRNAGQCRMLCCCAGDSVGQQ